jgi:hypothetical protein
MSLAPKMDHPRSVEPPLRNVQQCYAHIDDNEEGGRAPSTETDTRSRMVEKQPVTPEHLKKRPGSSEATGVPENSTSKRRQIIQNWSDEDEEENPTADLVTPRQRKGAKQLALEGSSRLAVTPSLGVPTASSTATSQVPPPSEGVDSSSGQQGSRGRPCRWAFSATHHQADM